MIVRKPREPITRLSRGPILPMEEPRRGILWRHWLIAYCLAAIAATLLGYGAGFGLAWLLDDRLSLLNATAVQQGARP